jgi:hypothetical protein
MSDITERTNLLMGESKVSDGPFQSKFPTRIAARNPST